MVVVVVVVVVVVAGVVRCSKTGLLLHSMRTSLQPAQIWGVCRASGVVRRLQRQGLKEDGCTMTIVGISYYLFAIPAEREHVVALNIGHL